MAMGNAPQAGGDGITERYAERYDWIVKEFTDLAFTFMTSFFYYMDYDMIDEQTRSLYVKAFPLSAAYPRLTALRWKRMRRYRMGFPFAADYGADVLFIHAHDKDSDMRMCKHCKKSLCCKPEGE